MSEPDPMKKKNINDIPSFNQQLKSFAAQGAAGDQMFPEGALLEELLNNTKQAIVLLNGSAEIVYASPGIEALLFYKPHEILGQNAFNFFQFINLPLVQPKQEDFDQPASPTFMLVEIKNKNNEFVCMQIAVINRLKKAPLNSILVIVSQPANLKENEELSVVQAIVHAREEERTFIANELHDNVNQMVAATKLLVDTAIHQENKEELLLLCSDNLKNIAEEVRRLSYSLASYNVLEDGLLHAIKALVRTIELGSSIKFHCSLDERFEQLMKSEYQLHLYRIVQEAITNVLKHSQATDVNICLMRNGRRRWLLIKDNGKGFHLARLQKGVGLSSIMQRIKLLKGNFKIRTRKNRGTALEIHFTL